MPASDDPTRPPGIGCPPDGFDPDAVAGCEAQTGAVLEWLRDRRRDGLARHVLALCRAAEGS